KYRKLRDNDTINTDTVEGIQMFHEVFAQNTLLIYHGLDAYRARTPAPWRVFVAYAQNINCWLLGLRFALVYLIPDSQLTQYWLIDLFSTSFNRADCINLQMAILV